MYFMVQRHSQVWARYNRSCIIRSKYLRIYTLISLYVTYRHFHSYSSMPAAHWDTPVFELSVQLEMLKLSYFDTLVKANEYF